MASAVDDLADQLAEKIKKLDPDLFNIQFSDLEDLEEIGGGNFGQVFRGSYMGIEVAVKKMLDVDDEDMHKYITREMLTVR